MKQKLLAALLCCAMLTGLLTGCGAGKPAENETIATPTPTVGEPETLPSEPVPETEPLPTEPETTEPPVTEPPLSPEELERAAFYEDFWELDPDTTDAWLAEHPEYFSEGYAGISINEAWLTDGGLDLYTTQGHRVLAIDAENRILIVRFFTDNGSRGTMAIAKDPARLHLCPAERLGVVGEKIGSIAQRNNGVLAMTGSGFIDEGGAGTGGELAGYCVCDGVEYGRPMGWLFSRFALREDNWAIVTSAGEPAGSDVTDAMEFTPALLIDGEPQDPGEWTGENPRACIGQNDRGEILMVVVEGRYKDSPGCSVVECANMMLEYGALNAVNCDGGTTAILWYRGQPITRCSNRGTPDGRYLPNAWIYEPAGEAD